MPLEERIAQLLPELREACGLADEAEELMQQWLEHPKALEHISKILGKKSEAAAEIPAEQPSEFDLLFENFKERTTRLGTALEALRRKIAGLRNTQEAPAFTETGKKDLAELVSRCIRLERTSAKRPLGVKVPVAESDGLMSSAPWFALPLGELFLEVLPRNPAPELLALAGDWIRMAWDQFRSVINHTFDDCEQTLAALATGLAGPVCSTEPAPDAAVVLALNGIADTLEDPLSLRARLQPVALAALESIPKDEEQANTFVSLLAPTARRILGDKHCTDQWPRLANLLWQQYSEDYFRLALDCIGPRAYADDTSRWDDYELDIVKGVGRALASMFWLARLYRQTGDEGREFYCAYEFVYNDPANAKAWEQLEVDFGWTEAEKKEVIDRYSVLKKRLVSPSQPWLLTPVMSQIELTPVQITAIAETAARSTAEALVGGGTLALLLSATIEPELRAAFTDKIWMTMPPAARQALLSATFSRKSQPPDFDFSGAVVLDWKAVELTLNARVFDAVWAGMPNAQRLAPRDRSLRLMLKWVLQVLQDRAVEPGHRLVRKRLEANAPGLLRLGGLGYDAELDIRNRAAHAERVGVDEFDRSRRVVLNLIGLLCGR